MEVWLQLEIRLLWWNISLNVKRRIITPDPGKRGTRAEGAHHHGSLPFIQMVYIYFVRL